MFENWDFDSWMTFIVVSVFIMFLVFLFVFAFGSKNNQTGKYCYVTGYTVDFSNCIQITPTQGAK